MLSEEQVQEAKEQLLKQIDKVPEEHREETREQIEAMNAEQLEEFLEKNKLIKKQGCIFCSIAKNEVSSYKIDENPEAIAILEINPVSKAHTIILPKEHKTIENTPSTLQLAQKVAKKIKSVFKPEDIKIETSSVQGHGIINIIPIFKDKKLERKKASEQELQELQKKLTEEASKESKAREKTEEESEKKPRKKRIRIDKLEKAPRRIP